LLKLAALITARGGSKRFPGKNLALLEGIPLILHSILYAKSAPQLIQSVWVSTDDNHIAQVAAENGANLIARPAEYATDIATSASVVKHALHFMPSDLDGVILLQPTNPLRPVGLLDSAIELFATNKYDSVYSVSPLHRKVGFIENNQFRPVNYDFGERSQDMKQIYFENGLIYISSIQTIQQDKIIGSNHGTLIVNHPYGQIDIDTEEDLKFAQWIMNQ
jgi:N-acylneuraminate cytidylyltransferase